MAITESDRATLQIQLGRLPRGLIDIAARCQCGAPVVATTAPRLADGTPFPTMFYLTHPAAVKGASTLEARGVMHELNAEMATDEALAVGYQRAHEDYLMRRAKLGEVAEIAGISAGGMPARVKCLHALLGHSLAVGRGINPIGDRVFDRLVADGLWNLDRCWCQAAAL